MHLSILSLPFFLSTSLAWLPGNKPSFSNSEFNTTTPWTTNTTTPYPSWPNPPNTTITPWKMRGVNLGSQFIIEPWMAYDEFTTMGCSTQPDESSCVQHLGQPAANTAFTTHWSTWITQEDILEIASFNLNTVRIPLPFWINEALILPSEFYPHGALPHLDNLVSWCADAGLYIILDLHAAPGAQAISQQFTGHSTPTPEFFNDFNYNRALQFLDWMTTRIHTNPSYRNVGMLEVLNEPVHTSESPVQAADMLRNFYPQALDRIRGVESSLGVKPQDALHVQYMSTAWGSGDPMTYMAGRDVRFVSFDDHRYLKWDPAVVATKDGYLQAACGDDRGSGVVVGEWSIAVADDVAGSVDFDVRSPSEEQIGWYQKYWATQAVAYEKSVGWVFWSWKCNFIGGVDDWRWCYQSAVQRGVIPRDVGEARGIAEGACAVVGAPKSTGGGGWKGKRTDLQHLSKHRLHKRW